MGISDKLDKRESWEEFLRYKKESGYFCAEEEAELRAYIENEGYKPVVRNLRAKIRFPYPVLFELNKNNSKKKRKVFVFGQDENYVFKLIVYLLGEYDYLFSENLYSFRREIGVKKAISDIIRRPDLSKLYSYKVDIHDYFNSADTDIAVNLMKDALKNDPVLAEFLEGILREPYCLWDGKPVAQKKGIMAGVPVSGFLANLYLRGLDELFADMGAIYARYSDDIIVFAQSAEQIAGYEAVIKRFIAERGLEINTRKEFKTLPGQTWEFLGYAVRNRIVDISEISLEKIKAKLKRKARALVRWKSRKGAKPEQAIRAFIKFMNKKFYDNPVHHEITWCRWYFPTITTAQSLRVIDAYAVQCIRFIVTGKHTKANYNLRYETIKSYGYRSLVHSFYEFKKKPKGELVL